VRRIGSHTHSLAALFNLVVEVSPSMFKRELTLLVAWVGWFVAPPGAAAAACQSPERVMGATPAQVRSHFAADGREVVSFLGYSGAGYEDPAAMLAQAGRILGRLDPKRAVINIVATADGIGAVYPLAKQRGFATTGIVSMEAARSGAELSPCVDLVFFVDDSTWGGYLPGTQTLLPTSEAMVTSSGRLFAIGGGDVARDELLAARSLGKPVTFIPADMNHVQAVKKAAHRGDPWPTDFGGAAVLAMQAAPGQTYGDPKVPVAGKVLGTVIHTRDAEELRYVVLNALTDRYAREEGISVTPQEKADYLQWLERLKRKDVQETAARRDELTRRLTSASLSDTERKALTTELESVNQLLDALGEASSCSGRSTAPFTGSTGAGSSSSRVARSRWMPTASSFGKGRPAATSRSWTRVSRRGSGAITSPTAFTPSTRAAVPKKRRCSPHRRGNRDDGARVTVPRQSLWPPLRNYRRALIPCSAIVHSRSKSSTVTRPYRHCTRPSLTMSRMSVDAHCREMPSISATTSWESRCSIATGRPCVTRPAERARPVSSTARCTRGWSKTKRFICSV
jgi:hypothetical protein